MTQENTLEDLGYKQELKRTLSTMDLVVYGLICMVPIAPMGVYGYVFAEAKGMVAMAYLVGLLGMIFTALSYAQMSKAIPTSGSVYAYAQRGINHFVGFMGGWTILLDYILIPSLLYIVAASAINAIVPSIPIFAWILLFIVLNTIINFFGIEMTATANKIILIAQIIVLIIFSAVTIMAISKGVNGATFTLEPLYQSKNFSISLILAATSTAVLSFLGYDSISTLSEEAKDGAKSIGKAAITSLVLISGLFILQTYLAALVEPHLMEAIESGKTTQDNAFYYVALLSGGKWLEVLAILSVVIAWGFANALGIQAATSRIIYSMARDKMLPSILNKVHPKFQTPYISTFVVAIISIGTSYIFMSDLGTLTTFVNFGALTGFLLINISVISYYIIKNKSKDYLNHLIFPLLGLTVVGFIYSHLGITAFKLGGAWLLIGVVVLAIASKGFRTKPPALNT